MALPNYRVFSSQTYMPRTQVLGPVGTGHNIFSVRFCNCGWLNHLPQPISH